MPQLEPAVETTMLGVLRKLMRSELELHGGGSLGGARDLLSVLTSLDELFEHVTTVC